MEEKKRTIVMFGDSLTDYFPMEKLKNIDAQFINSGVAVGRSLSFGKVVAYSPRGSLSHKRICLLYSVVKELWRKRVAFM